MPETFCNSIPAISKKPEKPKKPIFSDDLWDEVQDMREEYYITRRSE